MAHGGCQAGTVVGDGRGLPTSCMAVGPMTGNPELWARVLSRNIDVDARVRLDKGEVPGVDTRATPWGPTADADQHDADRHVNDKKVAVAEWHRISATPRTSYSSTTTARCNGLEEDDSWITHDPLA